MLFVIIGVVVVVAIALLAVRHFAGRADPVDSFRRQIDALSPEARRPTIDQVRRVDEDSGETEENGI